MPVIAVLVDTPRIVEECEQAYDLGIRPVLLGHSKPVLQNPCPMNQAMGAPYRQDVPVKNHFNDGGMVVHRDGLSLPSLT
jgi:hypothetical protein